MSQINGGNITQITPAGGRAIAETIRAVRAIPADRRATPNSFNSVSGGFTILWGKLTAAWTPGTNHVQLTPCKGPGDDTATGDPDVDCFVSLPLSRNPPCLGADTGDILGYVPIPDVVYPFILWQPPMLPIFTDQYQTIVNQSDTTDSPNVTADWPRAHPSP